MCTKYQCSSLRHHELLETIKCLWVYAGWARLHSQVVVDIRPGHFNDTLNLLEMLQKVANQSTLTVRGQSRMFTLLSSNYHYECSEERRVRQREKKGVSRDRKEEEKWKGIFLLVVQIIMTAMLCSSYLPPPDPKTHSQNLWFPLDCGILCVTLLVKWCSSTCWPSSIQLTTQKCNAVMQGSTWFSCGTILS